MSVFRQTMLLIAALVLAPSIQAGLSPENLPSMDNLGALLEATDRKEVKQATRANKGRIASGLPVPSDAARGTTAREISALLSGGDKTQEDQLVKAIMDERKAFEKVLGQHGFDIKDMGVAYAASFITLWELASHKQLPLEGSLAAGEFLVYTMKNVQPGYQTLSVQEKEQGYDWLMTTPVAFASLVKGFEQAGRIQEAEQLRSKSAALFKEVFRLPHDNIIITEQGDIEVDAEKIVEHGNNSMENEADALIDQALQLEESR